MNIERTFTYHKPEGTQPVRYEAIRAEAKTLAYLIDEDCPDSREKSLALTALQQAVMWANASIAVNENPLEPNEAPRPGVACPPLTQEDVERIAEETWSRPVR